MMPLAHLTISLGIAFCLEYRHKNRYAAVAALGLVGMLPDLDHFLPLYNGASLFHNTFALGILPLALIMISSAVEAKRDSISSRYQRFFICVAVVLAAHLLLDMIAGSGIYLGFPASAESFSIGITPVVEYPGTGALVLSTDILWLALLALVVTGNIVQKRMWAVFEGYTESPDIESMPGPYPSIFRETEFSRIDLTGSERLISI